MNPHSLSCENLATPWSSTFTTWRCRPHLYHPDNFPQPLAENHFGVLFLCGNIRHDTPRNSSSPARFKISEYLPAQFCGQFPAKRGTFPSNRFPFCLFRTLFPNGRKATPCDSRASALFPSQRGCGGYDRVENSRVSPASYQLSTIDCGLSCGPIRHRGPLPYFSRRWPLVASHCLC